MQEKSWMNGRPSMEKNKTVKSLKKEKEMKVSQNLKRQKETKRGNQLQPNQTRRNNEALTRVGVEAVQKRKENQNQRIDLPTNKHTCMIKFKEKFKTYKN